MESKQQNAVRAAIAAALALADDAGETLVAALLAEALDALDGH